MKCVFERTIKLLVLRLTERCNLRCAYCYAAREDRVSFDMTEDTALRTVELCCPPGGSLRIQFTGGEPLLRLDLMEAVAVYGKNTNRRLVLSVQTNATLLTPEVCRRLKAIRCGVGVSLDGLEEANCLRVFPDGRASFHAAVQGVQNLGQAGLRCGMTAVVTHVNVTQLGQLADLALYLGNVVGVGLDLFRPLGRGAGQDLAPLPKDLVRGVRDLKERSRSLAQANIPFRFRELERLRRRRELASCGTSYCYAQTGVSLAVDGRGDCWPCSSLAGQEGYRLGNIRDGLPEQRSTLRALEVPEKCRQCDSYLQCLGGCPARRTAQDDLTCVMHQALTE